MAESSKTEDVQATGEGEIQNYTQTLLSQLPVKAKIAEASTKLLFKKLKRKTPRHLDTTMMSFHQEVFNEVDCLDCANCCRSLGPRITDNDIQKLAKALKIKPGKVIESYLKVDEDGDFVFQQMPCPFLMNDNYCMVYELRPKACRDYPHTDRRRFEQAFSVTTKNVYTCPAAYLIVEKLKTVF